MKEITRERALAIAGVTGLLLVGLWCLVMIASVVAGDDEPEIQAAAPITTSTPTPTATPEPKPTPVPLSPSERAARDAAAELIRGKGFEPVRLRDYDPRRKLRVMLGEDVAGSRLAFFFVDDLYIGNDRSRSSQELKVKRAGNIQVILTYDGSTDVRFKWNGSALVPQDPLPG